MEKEERENLLRQEKKERVISGLKALGSVWDKHFFRHAYDSDIDEDKFKIMAKNVVNLRGLFEKE